MFHNLEDLIHTEVVCGLKAAVLAGPRQRLAILAIWLKLQEGVINAVKEDFVVYVLALSDQHAQHLRLAAGHLPLTTRSGLCLCVGPLARFFPPLLQRQVQVERQHLREVLVKVFAAADLRVLQLVKQRDVVLRQRLVQQFQEIARIN